MALFSSALHTLFIMFGFTGRMCSASMPTGESDVAQHTNPRVCEMLKFKPFSMNGLPYLLYLMSKSVKLEPVSVIKAY